MQVVFDNWKFREILKSIVEKKELNGDRISSKQQLYMRIGEALHVSPDTVKYWQRDKSSGPDPRTPELLKELFGISWCFAKEDKHRGRENGG